jgi:hypothetical protein
MERISKHELLRAQREYASGLEASCAPIVEFYRKRLEAAFQPCRDALLASVRTGTDAWSTPSACKISTGQLVSTLERKCVSIIENKLDVDIIIIDRSGDNFERSEYFDVNITKRVME